MEIGRSCRSCNRSLNRSGLGYSPKTNNRLQIRCSICCARTFGELARTYLVCTLNQTLARPANIKATENPQGGCKLAPINGPTIYFSVLQLGNSLLVWACSLWVKAIVENSHTGEMEWGWHLLNLGTWPFSPVDQVFSELVALCSGIACIREADQSPGRLAATWPSQQVLAWLRQECG